MRGLNGGEVLARALADNGVTVLFGIPGVQLDPVFAGLHDVRDRIRVVHARHEQGVALMAFGYAQVSGNIGVVLVVPGPGFLNATTGLLTAHACNAPLLCLAGQSERRFISSGVGVLHELQDQIGIARTMSKWAARVEQTAQLASLLAEALEQIRTLRPRPAYLELPSDIVRMPVADPAPVLARRSRVLPPLDSQQVEATAQALARAKFPLLLCGGGATGAAAEIRRLAELLGAPVGMSENGLGTLDARHPLAFTQLGANKLWGRADLALALGTRLYQPIFNWGWDEDLKIIKVDIDATELTRVPAPLTGIHADSARFVSAVCEALPRYLKAPRSHALVLNQVRAECAVALAPLEPARRIVEVIRTELGEDGILVVDVTQLNHHCLDLYPVYRPRTYITSGYQGTLGFGPCTALGAKLARPEAPVVCLVGDGGFMYACQELATAVQFDIPVVMLVLNDGSYKNVEMILDNNYGGRAIGTTLLNPDFVKFAESFGVAARRVDTPEMLQVALRELLAANRPAVVDYRLGELPSAFWLRFLPQVRRNKPADEFSLMQK